MIVFMLCGSNIHYHRTKSYYSTGLIPSTPVHKMRCWPFNYQQDVAGAVTLPGHGVFRPAGVLPLAGMGRVHPPQGFTGLRAGFVGACGNGVGRVGGTSRAPVEKHSLGGAKPRLQGAVGHAAGLVLSGFTGACTGTAGIHRMPLRHNAKGPPFRTALRQSWYEGA